MPESSQNSTINITAPQTWYILTCHHISEMMWVSHHSCHPELRPHGSPPFLYSWLTASLFHFGGGELCTFASILHFGNVPWSWGDLDPPAFSRRGMTYLVSCGHRLLAMPTRSVQCHVEAVGHVGHGCLCTLH